MKFRPVEIQQVLRDTIRSVESQIRSKGLRLEVQLPDRPVMVVGDPTRLQQVFWNLLKNAMKFTPTGGDVALRSFIREGEVLTEVCDTGVGIEPAVLPRLFNPFEQGPRLVTKRYGGLGLGLAIAKGIVQQHGGHIEARSEGPNRGATFTVHLPAVEHIQQSPQPRAAEMDPEQPRRLRVLLVEDHADTLRSMTRLLREQGYEVLAASDVASAQHEISRDGPDVLVSDVTLPDGSGLDLMRTARLRRFGIAGVAISGHGQPEDIRRSRDAGFSDHLVKPIDIDRLDTAIRHAAGRK